MRNRANTKHFSISTRVLLKVQCSSIPRKHKFSLFIKHMIAVSSKVYVRIWSFNWYPLRLKCIKIQGNIAPKELNRYLNQGPQYRTVPYQSFDMGSLQCLLQCCYGAGPVTGGPRTGSLSDRYVPPIPGGTIRYCRPWLKYTKATVKCDSRW